MGDILETIKSRRSIRRYTDEPVPDEMIDKILEAARWAPTGENHQPWRLIVVRDPEMRVKLHRMTRKWSAVDGMTWNIEDLQKRVEGIKDPERKAKVLAKIVDFFRTGDSQARMLKAPVIIVVTGFLKTLDTTWDLSACIENILLEAHSLGLGACWVNQCPGPREELKWKQLLKIPVGMGEYKILAYVSIGWPAESPGPRPKKSLDEIVYWEEFGNTRRR